MKSFEKKVLKSLGAVLLAQVAFGLVARAGISKTAPAPVQKTIPSLCSGLDSVVSSLNWKLEPCATTGWKQAGTSIQGRPLIYVEYGDPSATNTTLIFSTVHGDEMTPLYLGLRLSQWLRENVKGFKDGKVHVVLAPLINPDGLFGSPRTRVNARGVDLNRNFATREWTAKAIQDWKKRFHADKRRFPGNSPASEPETVFQQEMIRKFKPQKILSIHSPLNFMDYDGPTTLSLDKFPREYVDHCLKLRNQLRAISSGYFPGSLGNFAGRELGIPTLTLELPTADPRKALEYWTKFSEGIRTMIQYEVPGYSWNSGGAQASTDSAGGVQAN